MCHQNHHLFSDNSMNDAGLKGVLSLGLREDEIFPGIRENEGECF